MKHKGISIQQTEHEHKQIRKDFAFVVVLNLGLFAIMVGLYFWNKSTGALDQLFAQLLNF